MRIRVLLLLTSVLASGCVAPPPGAEGDAGSAGTPPVPPPALTLDVAPAADAYALSLRLRPHGAPADVRAAGSLALEVSDGKTVVFARSFPVALASFGPTARSAWEATVRIPASEIPPGNAPYSGRATFTPDDGGAASNATFSLAPPPRSEAPGCPEVHGRRTAVSTWRIETSVGTMVAELCREMVPATVAHFVALAADGAYQGASFYRVVGPSPSAPNGFVIQGGLQSGAARVPKIADEFHPLLRHDRAGVLSVAHAGPNTGSSEFFITLDGAEHLDDRHSVFGYVVRGLSVLRAIGNAKVAGERPVTPITIARIDAAEPPALDAVHRAWSVVAPIEEKPATPGRPVRFALVVGNDGNAFDEARVSVVAPEGWSVEPPPGPVGVPAWTARVAFVSATPPVGAAGTSPITVTVASARGPATVTLALRAAVGDLGDAVVEGNRVMAEYVGMTADGRLFDTSREAAAKDARLLKMATAFALRGEGRYTPFAFTVGSGVIAGFTELAKTARVGEDVVALVPAAQAYATGSVYDNALVGKALVFDLAVLRVCPPGQSTC